MAVVRVHRDRYILSQSTRAYLEFSENQPLEIWLRKRMPWCVRTCSGRRRTSPPLAIPGTRLRKSPSAHPGLLGLPPGLPLAWLRPAHRLYTVPGVLVSSGESTSEPWLLLVFKFSISSNFIFLQDTWVEFIEVEFLTYRELSGDVSGTGQVYSRAWLSQAQNPWDTLWMRIKMVEQDLLHLHLSLPLTLPFPSGGEE